MGVYFCFAVNSGTYSGIDQKQGRTPGIIGEIYQLGGLFDSQ
jgi:hypothetical protein